MQRIYDPWVGSNYIPGEGLLLLSESAYEWDGGRPGADHPTVNTVNCWSLDRWDNPGSGKGVYARMLTRTLCGEAHPSSHARRAGWNNVAYSIFVQRVMKAYNDRPTKADFLGSHDAFCELLSLLRPARIVVTGYQMWNNMPECKVHLDPYLGAYELPDGQLSWCLALPHPQSRSPSFRWSEMALRIAEFRTQTLPK